MIIQTAPAINGIRKGLALRNSWTKNIVSDNYTDNISFKSPEMDVCGVRKNHFNLILTYRSSPLDIEQQSEDALVEFIKSSFSKINELTGDFLDIAFTKCINNLGASVKITPDDFGCDLQTNTKKSIFSAVKHSHRFRVELRSMPYYVGKKLFNETYISPLLNIEGYGFRTDENNNTSNYYWDVSLGKALVMYIKSLRDANKRLMLPYILLPKSASILHPIKESNEKKLLKGLHVDFKINKKEQVLHRRISTIISTYGLYFGDKSPFLVKNALDKYLDRLKDIGFLSDWRYKEETLWSQISKFKRHQFDTWMDSVLILVLNIDEHVKLKNIGVQKTQEQERPEDNIPIRQLIKESRYTQTQMADKLGFTRSYISKISSSIKPPPKELLDLLSKKRR